jgi:hypothetical protein
MSAVAARSSAGLAPWPIPATTPPTRIPRADALTDALLGGTALADPETASREARARLERGLAATLAPVAHPRVARIGHHQVARVLAALLAASPTALPVPESRETFRWSSWTARRSVGLAAVRLGLEGRAATPSDAVARVMSDPGGPLGVGRQGPGSCADWLSSLAPPARSIVAAEATAWATRLWTSLDWGRLDPRQLSVGGPDRWWRWSGTGRAARIALRGRADIRIRVGATVGDGLSHGAHLVVLDGHPGAATRHGLMLSALVDALSSLRSPESSTVPSRVVGWWPDSGRAWIVPVDAETLAIAVDAVVVTAGALLGAPHEPGGADAPGAPGDNH